ncbi:DUF4407 domain-containing protein [Microbispora sp. NBC_01189]|uniref:DUF4407 domain-containing protein n=1 Tax=Microbispora sp. NBC_01189 TaxID=2903583 RepID=UPI002E1076BF|nr:DUF4407 domain-containing protein [Microbispora sp. NBC_01189]
MNEEFTERAKPLPQTSVSLEFIDILEMLGSSDRRREDSLSRSLLSTWISSRMRGATDGGHVESAEPTVKATPLPIKKTRSVFLWLGGVDPEIVRYLPMLRLRYQAIGTAVLVSGVISGSSLWYSLTYLLNSSRVVGVITGVAIALFDIFLTRLLLVAEANQRSFGLRLLHAAPRVAISFAIAFVVSTPLLMQMFSFEVDSALKQSRSTRIAAFSAMQERNPMLVELETSILKTQKQISENIACSFRTFGGTSSTKAVAGRADPCEANSRQTPDRGGGFAENQKALLDLTAQISDMRIRQQSELETYARQVNGPAGLLERIDALTAFRSDSTTARNIFFALLCVIALLESLPVVIGLLSPRTAYDLLLYAEERVATLKREAEIAARLEISEQVLGSRADRIDLESVDAIVRVAVDSSVQAAQSEIRSEIIDFAAEREKRRVA